MVELVRVEEWAGADGAAVENQYRVTVRLKDELYGLVCLFYPDYDEVEVLDTLVLEGDEDLRDCLDEWVECNEDALCAYVSTYAMYGFHP